MADTITRRRAICIMAATAGLPLIPFVGPALAAADPVVWRGQALGAPATLILNHPDKAKAEALVRRVVAEVGHLESIFSLYRDDSSLSELNRAGALVAPPPELVTLLERCGEFWAASGRKFDPTVQPLWVLFARHFATQGADLGGPSRQEIDAAASLVGFDAVKFNRDRVVFARPGMALTFNGIAQGFVTDRVVDLLRQEGITSSLVNMGESRAIGARADGTPWRIGLSETEDGATIDEMAALVDKAVSTSSPFGFHFDPALHFSHLIDPRMGSIEPLYRRLSVIAPDAVTADALSTAFTLTALSQVRSFVQASSDISVDLMTIQGEHIRLGPASERTTLK